VSSNFTHQIPFSKSKISAIVLAAGSSSRLGHPKQLVKFQGKTLIVHALEQALFAKFRSVFVVLGANEDLIKPVIRTLPINVILNKNWEKGMGSSISVGVKYLERVHPDSEGVVLMTCDQPFLTSDLLKKIVDKHQTTHANLVASRYEETIGIPAFFSSKLFEELKVLDGQKGAKNVLLKYCKEAGFIEFLKGEFDVDREEDIEKLKKMEDLNFEKWS